MVGFSVRTIYGNERNYVIDKVNYSLNPQTCFFENSKKEKVNLV